MKKGIASVILFSIFPILFVYFRNQYFIYEGGLSYPITLISIGASLLYLLANKLNQKQTNNILVVVLISMWFLLYGHIYTLALDTFSIHHAAFRHRYYFPIYSLLFLIPIIKFWRAKPMDEKLINVVLIIGITLNIQFILPTIQLLNVDKKELVKQKKRTIPVANSLPDVYYIIADSYPSNSILKQYYNFDNTSFTNQLKALQFQVIDGARSNYPYTYFSLPSSLNREYINYFEDSVSVEKQNADFPFQKIHKNKTADYFKSKGYQYVLFQSAYEELNNDSQADIYFEVPKQINHFVQKLIELSVISTLNIQVYSKQIFDLTNTQFSNLNYTPIIQGNKFVFFHCMPPHPPQVFDVEGNYTGSLPYSENRYQLKEAYTNQLQFVNTTLLKTIKKIINTSKEEPIIIVQGDHGTCSSEKYEYELKWESPPSEELLNERYGILNAIYLPEKYKIEFPTNHTPVNTFSLIINKVFGDSLAILPNKSFFANYKKPYNFKEINWKDN